MADREIANEVRKMAKLDAAATVANKAAEEARKAKAAQRRRVYQLLEARDLDAVKTGQSLVSRYVLPFAKINDLEAFKAWAAGEDESYFEDEPRARTELLNGLVRQRLDDDEPLPPGVTFYPDERVSRNKA